MSGFCGWLGREIGEDGAQVLERMLRCVRADEAGESETLIGRRSAVGASCAIHPPRIGRASGYLVVAQGHFTFEHTELARRAAELGPVEALAEGFLKLGTGLPARLKGSFAIAILEEDGNRGLLAVDRVAGRYPLNYTIRNSCLIFGTHGSSIQANPLGRSEVDRQGIYNYLYFSVIPAPGSIRKNVSRLLPGTYLEFSSGKARTGTYWTPVFQDGVSASLEDLSAEFRSLVKSGVATAVSGEQTGCFLSGGTDSSTVAGMVGEVTGNPARTYSIGFDAEGFDEMKFARIAAERFGTDHHEYYLTREDLLETIPRVARAYADPFGNASAVAAYFCARLARGGGVRRMLGGDGGDELFAGNSRYAVQRTFELYNRVPVGLRHWLLEPAVFGLPGGDRIAPVRKAKSYIRQAKIPMPGRMESYNHLERAGIESVFEPEFLSSVDPNEPRRHLSGIYDAVEADSMINRMLALDFKITLADNDLPKVSRMCEMADVEAVYPFLSDEILEFSLRVPVRWKLKGLSLRWFFKYALRDFLPESILRKKKQGFGLPFGVWMRQHDGLRELAYGSLGGLKSRGVVRPDYLDQLIHLHATDHATYYGAMIWVLMMLEQWFRQHEDV